MAPWCLSVIVLFCIQQVIARDCSSLEKIRNCDECIRCGGIWCNVPHMNRHCGERLDDSWCPNNRELLQRGPSREELGTSLQPALVTKTMLVGSEPEIVKISFDQQTKNPKPPVSVSFVNSTIYNMQTSFEVHFEHTECRHGKCATGIVAKPLTDFCPLNGSVAESVTIKVKVEGIAEEAVVQYQVPCACDCSQAVEEFSQKCHGHGDFSCGACSCHDGCTIYNMQTSFEVHFEHTECRHGKCATGIVAKPLTDFCPLNGSVAESVTIKVKVEGIAEEAVVQYQVPCACDCSQAVEEFSQKCHGHGDFSCGACSCHDGWNGEFCELEKTTKPPPAQCNDDRGDISGDCIRPGLDESEQVCSGNGRCHCGRCECFQDRPNYQYFNTYCEDICASTRWCDHCLFQPKPGICDHCDEVMFIENTTIVPEGDVWVQCNETQGDCTVRYAAMRNDNNEVRVIVLNSCDAVQAIVAGPVNVTLPIVLGIIAILATAAAVAGFMVWKNRTPPLPLTDPQYTNIGAEDCTGINPLYKPPTSSFKNPTYGKC